MADILRLKRWTTYLADGKSYCGCTTGDKSVVAIAVIVGFEPAKIDDDSQWLNVDDVIVDIAKHIERKRKSRRPAPKGR